MMRASMKTTARKRAFMYFPMAFLALCAAALGSCSVPGIAQAPGDASGAKAFSVGVSLSGASLSASKGSGKAISGDPSVSSVAIYAFDAGTGLSAGSGTLASTGGAWSGPVTVTKTGQVLFQSYAYSSTGGLLYVGEKSQSISGSDDHVVIDVTGVKLLGGTIQKKGQTLSTTPNSLAPSAHGVTYPTGITSDGLNLYVASWQNPVVISKIVISSGVTTTTSRSATGWVAQGTGTAALTGPAGITTDGTNLYVAEWGANRITKVVIATADLSVFAGDPGTSPGSGSTDGTGTAARFNQPWDVTTDGSYLYVADSGNSTLRRIAISTTEVTTLASGGFVANPASATAFGSPGGVTTDGTSLYYSDDTSQTIVKVGIASSLVTTFAGSGTAAEADGQGTGASFNNPSGMSTDGTSLFVADYSGNTVRQVALSSADVTTVGTGISKAFFIATDGASLYVTLSK
jgi:sugar lactone lactonase YvrE